jgi:tetratricopeptide (TPR) repeat protein
MAIRDLTYVIQKNSDHVNALFARAACYNTIGQFSAAIEDYNIALLKDQSQNLLRAASPEKARRSSFGGSVSSRMDPDGHLFDHLLFVSHSR